MCVGLVELPFKHISSSRGASEKRQDLETPLTKMTGLCVNMNHQTHNY